MIELKAGCSVPFPEKLFEQYEVSENCITANVNASKVTDMMERFITEHKEEYLFFILEIHTNIENETKIGENEVENFSEDVYYIDGLDTERALQILNTLGNFLVKDGLNTFGFGCHNSEEEIILGKYNVMTIYTRKAENYRDFFSDFGIEETNNLITAWQTFDSEHCGQCRRYEGKDGRTIFDIPEAFKNNGMYFYERRSGKPLTPEDVIGKTLLAGITYYRGDKLADRVEVWGVVTEINENHIAIKQNNGEIFSLPPDLSSVRKANIGSYTLPSTGEVVTNPDFTSNWRVEYPEE